MNFFVIIPAHNEERFISKTLQSLIEQTTLPKKIIVVNDNSSDKTEAIVKSFTEKHQIIQLCNFNSSEAHLPGSKVIKAFNFGFQQLNEDFDVICKFDADLIFPKNYFEELEKAFQKSSKIGMVGGFCYIEKNGDWQLESLTNKDHIRGALKAYRKTCFEQIGGLKTAMGWDTVDELLARYHSWEIKTIPELKVKHLRPTASGYQKTAGIKQGEAFYRLGYGFNITFIASLKLALRKKKPALLKDYLKGYFSARKSKSPLLVTKEEAKWIRNYRWKKIKEKLF